MAAMDLATVEIKCPGCHFYNEVFVRQIRTEDVVICMGCKGNIQLIDEYGQFGRLEDTVRNMIKKIFEQL